MLIPKPPENRETCFICGRKAVTVEHVIPKWLQHRYGLWDELLSLPNGQSIPYRKLLVPSCKKCNNEVYGQLENRVCSGNATESDIWKWANKIHYALCYKDRIFDWDRKNTGYKIGDIISPDDPFEKDRHFLHCVSGDFNTHPDPYGSVFKFNFREKANFAFAHLIQSNSLSFTLGDVGYVVFVTDGQTLKREQNMNRLYNQIGSPCRREDMLFFHAQCVEMTARHELSYSFIMSEGFISRVGNTIVRKAEPPNKNRFRTICDQLGLDWIDADESTT